MNAKERVLFKNYKELLLHLWVDFKTDGFRWVDA